MLNHIQNVSEFTSLLTEKKKLYEKVSTNMIGYIGSLKDQDQGKAIEEVLEQSQK